MAITSVAGLDVSLGNQQAALATLEPQLRTLEEVPNRTEIFVAPLLRLPDAIESLIHLGRLHDAERLITLIEANGSRLDRPWMLAVGGRCRALLLAAKGDVDAACDSAYQTMTEHDRLPMPFERARTGLVLGQIQRRQRRRDAASATLQKSLAGFESLDAPLWTERARAERDSEAR